jgi:hypothetical protein
VYEVPLSTTTKRSRYITSHPEIPLYDLTGELDKHHESLIGKVQSTITNALSKHKSEQQHVVVVAPTPAAAPPPIGGVVHA